MGTLFIPNTLMIVKGCPNPLGARQLVDYLLGAEVEAKLAEGPSGQIPLNPAVKMEKLPVTLPNWDSYGRLVDFAKIVDRWDEAQTFLAEEFAAR